MSKNGDLAAFSGQNSTFLRSRNPLFSTLIPVLLPHTPLAPDQAGDREASRGRSWEVQCVLGFCWERQSTPSWVWPTLPSGAMLQEAESEQSRRAPSPGKSPAEPYKGTSICPAHTSLVLLGDVSSDLVSLLWPISLFQEEPGSSSGRGSGSLWSSPDSAHRPVCLTPAEAPSVWQDDQLSQLLHWLPGDALVDTCPVGAEDPPPPLAFFLLWTHLLIRSKSPPTPPLRRVGAPAKALTQTWTPARHYSGETSCPHRVKD